MKETRVKREDVSLGSRSTYSWRLRRRKLVGNLLSHVVVRGTRSYFIHQWELIAFWWNGCLCRKWPGRRASGSKVGSAAMYWAADGKTCCDYRDSIDKVDFHLRNNSYERTCLLYLESLKLYRSGWNRSISLMSIYASGRNWNHAPYALCFSQCAVLCCGWNIVLRSISGLFVHYINCKSYVWFVMPPLHADLLSFHKHPTLINLAVTDLGDSGLFPRK